MKRIAIVLSLLVLSGCVTVDRIGPGDRDVGERLALTIDGAWNHVSAPGIGPAQTWTMEGLPVDQLLLYSGLKDGQAIHAQGGGGTEASRKEYIFRSTMQPDEIAALFEGMLTRDGSRFKLLKLEPTNFGGVRGFRFDYELVRKLDNVHLNGFSYAAVSNGELFAVLYLAPRLTFYSRNAPSAEKIARSARIR